MKIYSTIHEVAQVTILGNKNGITLKEILTIATQRKVYELYMDGELLNRFTSAKVAMTMFKDFSA